MGDGGASRPYSMDRTGALLRWLKPAPTIDGGTALLQEPNSLGDVGASRPYSMVRTDAPPPTPAALRAAVVVEACSYNG